MFGQVALAESLTFKNDQLSVSVFIIIPMLEVSRQFYYSGFPED